jgi:hypothetical protein
VVVGHSRTPDKSGRGKPSPDGAGIFRSRNEESLRPADLNGRGAKHNDIKRQISISFPHRSSRALRKLIIFACQMYSYHTLKWMAARAACYTPVFGQRCRLAPLVVAALFWTLLWWRGL